MIVKLTPQIRIKIVVLSMLVLLVLPIWTLMMVHYFIYPLPYFFSIGSSVPNHNNEQLDKLSDINILATVSNSMLICVFFLQHIVMASIKYKTKINNIWPLFPLYQRLIYNIISALTLILVFWLQKPQNLILFQLSWYLSIPILICSLIMLTSANLSMQRSLMVPYTYKQLFVVNQIRLENYKQKVREGINSNFPYSLIRHPMQAAVLWAFTLGNPVITFQKITAMTILSLGIVFGVIKQQKRLQSRFIQYHEYKKRVKARFIPYLI